MNIRSQLKSITKKEEVGVERAEAANRVDIMDELKKELDISNMQPNQLFYVGCLHI